MVYEPLPRATSAGMHKAATNTRWRSWYSNIADVMMRNPRATIKEIAAELGRSPATIGVVVSSDTFKDYFARRRQEYSERHDFAIMTSLQEIAVSSLGALSHRLRSDQVGRVPTRELRETAQTVLDRLGYAPETKPQVAVNVTSQTLTVAPTSLSTLQEARNALRAAETIRAGSAYTTIQPLVESQAPGSSQVAVPPLLQQSGFAEPSDAPEQGGGEAEAGEAGDASLQPSAEGGHASLRDSEDATLQLLSDL